MKALLKETPYTEFRVHLLNVPEYKRLAKKAISVFIQMPQRIYVKLFFC